MILPTSTYREVHNAFIQENEKVGYWWVKVYSQIYKRFYTKLKQGQLYLWEYWTHPVSRNKYLFCYATSRSQILRDKTDASGQALLVVDDFANRDFYYSTPGILLHITSHFIKRYRERCLHDDSVPTEEVVARYLHRNIGSFLELDPDNLNYQGERDEMTYNILVPDGVVYFQIGKDSSEGMKDVIVIRYKTFVSESLLNEEQKKEVDSARDALRDRLVREDLEMSVRKEDAGEK